ncbi:MAG: hypothetical protein LBR61_12455 [Synergistaceae bacterium]|nr:hypothetical protein [Synergistaceae bacterium]
MSRETNKAAPEAKTSTEMTFIRDPVRDQITVAINMIKPVRHFNTVFKTTMKHLSRKPPEFRSPKGCLSTAANFFLLRRFITRLLSHPAVSYLIV